ncbi:hypothetical protein H0H92_005761 [Tricholoma furcatifolium]|nr:hypothetical protein H0H92_005761 [Tricholoma furcatifolium]
MSPPTIVYRSEFQPRPGFFKRWERTRNRKEVHWLVECFAEALGVFFYVYAGVGSQAAWVTGNILVDAKLAPVGLSSIFQIGWGYMGGILLALAVCSGTSGGHFNPCVSLTFVVFKGFPPLKALRYAVSQILGAYIACMIVYSQYKVLFDECTEILVAAGSFESTNYTPNGLAGVFAFYLLPGQTIGRAFLNEFVSVSGAINAVIKHRLIHRQDTFIALTIWAALDSTNALVPPAMSPVLVAIAYGVAIWGFSLNTLVANSARDIGGRLASMTIYGTGAAGGAYSAVAALTNIPATLFGAFLYEFFLTDSDRAFEYGVAHHNHRRHLELRPHEALHSESAAQRESFDKPTTLTYEHSGTANRV